MKKVKKKTTKKEKTMIKSQRMLGKLKERKRQSWLTYIVEVSTVVVTMVEVNIVKVTMVEVTMVEATKVMVIGIWPRRDLRFLVKQ